jgi:hypothetical protein
MPPLPAAESLPLAHRIVRLISLAGVVYAISMLIGEFHTLLSAGAFSWLRGTYFSQTRVLQRPSMAVFYLMVANHILLAISGMGLWRYRWWARRCAIIWAVIDIVLNVSSRIISLLEIQAYYARAVPKQPMPPLTTYFLSTFGYWAASTIPAAAVLYLMWQREVAALFDRTITGGFDVVPMAQRAE